MLQNQPNLRRLIMIGTPLLTAILLLFHPRPNPAEVTNPELPGGDMNVYALLSPVADLFLVVHVLFVPALVLLGMTVILLLNDVHSVAAKISRFTAILFVVTYVMYETIIGTVSALLVRGAFALSVAEQEVISRAVNRIFSDPLLGDGPSMLALAAWLSWVATIVLAAVALRREGRPLAPCILLGLSCVFFLHASPLGPLAMIFMLVAVLMLEWQQSPRVLPAGARL